MSDEPKRPAICAKCRHVERLDSKGEPGNPNALPMWWRCGATRE